jgi:hypothetical protein
MKPERRNLRYAKALAHPLRIRILMAMNTPRRQLSPKEFSDESGEPLGHCSYHMRKLEEYGCVALTDTKQRRGAVEHYYSPVKRAMAWTEESKVLPPAMLDGFAATVLGGFVVEAGEAIDSGEFNERDDRVLAWDKMWVDEQGWHKLIALAAETLAKAMEIEEECDFRRDEGAEGFFASYALVVFESAAPPKPSNGDGDTK